MSKSRGNVVAPDEMIDRYGADTVRLFCLFAAPPERDFEWSDAGIEGAFRFLNRVWRLFAEVRPHILPVPACSSAESAAGGEAAGELRLREHATVRKVSEDIGNRYQFNTAIAAVMELVNAVYLLKDELIRSPQGREILSSAMATVLTLLFPVTPHLCEELWQELGHAEPLARQSWPEWKEDALRRDVVTMVIQINGKLRGRMDVPAGTPDEEVKRAALAEPAVARHLERENLTVRRVVVVPGRLVNVVAG